MLVLHGFTGNPYVDATPRRTTAPRRATASSCRDCPGHGTTIEDMVTTTWSDWSRPPKSAYDELAARCDEVAVVGLSMGGGLTAYVAEQPAQRRRAASSSTRS